MTVPIKRVLVVGGGSAGFLSALTLQSLLPDLQVSVVRSAKIPVIGVGESTTPFVPRHLHQYIGIDKKAFFDAVRPSWKLGVRFEWGAADGTHFNYPFDGENLKQWHPPLQWVDAYYCTAGMKTQSVRAAMMEQMCSPIIQRQQGGFEVDENVAYHLENRAFIAFLEKETISRGIKVIDGDVVDVEQTETGDVSAVKLEDGQNLTADLFIDCTGFRSLLLEKTLGTSYVSYADSLFCDKAVVGSFERNGPVPPYTTAETMDNGWCWRIEFEDHVTRGYVYSSNFCSDEQAKEELLRKNPEMKGEDLRGLSFPSGRYENFWTNNVAAIGNASGFVEPLEATAIHLISVQLQLLVQGIKDSGRRLATPLIDLQNRRYRDIWDDVRDFLAIHYKFNKRTDSEFWKHCREHTNLGGAEQVVELFQEVGPTVRMIDLLPTNSIFGHTGYVTMLMGQKVESRWNPDIPQQDWTNWNTLQQKYQQLAAQALPVRDALDLVRNPQWHWPSAVRNVNQPAKA